MKTLAPPRQLLVVMTAAVDTLIVFDAFSVAYLLRFRLHVFARQYFDPAPLEEYLKAMVVIAYFWILLFYVFGLYDFSKRRSRIDVFHQVLKAVSFGTLIILSLTYFYREFSFSRLVCVYAWVLSVILFVLFRMALQNVRDSWFRDPESLRPALTVGSRTLARFLVDKTRRQPELGYRVIGVVDREPPDEAVDGCPYLGRMADLGRIIKERGVEAVFIAHPTLGHFELLEVIHSCEEAGVAIRMVPPTYDLQINYRDMEEIDGIPVVKINEKEYRRFDDILKRALDLVIAIPALILGLPIWALIALAIKLDDGGPVFFRQVRVGKDGKQFSMWKFRSMSVDAEKRLEKVLRLDQLDEPVFKLENDSRVTRVGRFLRRASLDELPQLINVSLGEMSLVGPRPEEEKLVRMYNVWERRRLKARPGITGLQQVTCRGSTSLKERVRWDILYLRKGSVFLDLWILLRTAWAVIRGDGAR